MPGVLNRTKLLCEYMFYVGYENRYKTVSVIIMSTSFGYKSVFLLHNMQHDQTKNTNTNSHRILNNKTLIYYKVVKNNFYP